VTVSAVQVQVQAGGGGLESRCMQKVLGIFPQQPAAGRGDTYTRGALGGCAAGVIHTGYPSDFGARGGVWSSYPVDFV